MDDFDPYQQWLGIAPHERPIDHYRLLGLARFEMNVAAIGAAADERMTLVRSFQTGPRGAFTQRLLNELATARVCLLNPQTKATYDDFLHGLAAAHASGGAPTAGAAGALLPGMPAPFAGVGPATAAPSSYAASAASFVPQASAYPHSPYAAGAPMAQPVASYGTYPNAWSGAAPGAIPMATPVAYYPAGIPPQMHGIPAAGAPLAAAPATAPPLAPPSSSPAAPPAPPPVTRRKPAARDSSADAESRDTENADAAPAEAEPLVTRRWFPVAVIAAVAIVAGIVWGVGQALRSPGELDDSATAAVEGGSEGENAGDEPGDTPTKPAPPADDYPSEVILSQEGNGDVNFPASVAQLHGESLTLNVEGPDPVIAGWTGDADSVSWDFRVVKPDIFRVEITYAASADWGGGQFTATVGDAEKSGDVVSSGGPDKFRTDKLFLPVKRKGKHVLTIRTTKRPGEQLWVLKSIRFIPQGVAGK